MNEEEQTIDLSTDGFSTVTYPGPEFRPLPGFSFDVPPGWIVSDFPDSLCLIGTPAESKEPWSNVILQHQRVLRTTALEEVALDSWEKLQVEFPDVEVIEERMLGLEQFHYVRETRHTFLGERVTRFDSYVFGLDTDHATVDLFHFVFMHPVEAGEERSLLYMKMLASFDFD
jgi:hypothetical protein